MPQVATSKRALRTVALQERANLRPVKQAKPTNLELVREQPSNLVFASPEIRVHKMRITPVLAQEFMARNLRNRSIARTTVNSLKYDMANESWKFTGDPIRFDRNGFLIDAQHRLTACIELGIEFDAIVITGLDPSVQDVIDTGRKRTLSDVLALHGCKVSTTALAAAAKLLLVFKSGVSEDSLRGRLTHAQGLQVAQKHAELAESVACVAGTFGLRPSLLAAVHYVGGQLIEGADRDTADAFVHVFRKGIPGYEDCAAHLWREKLVQTRKSGAGFVKEVAIRGTVHSWNNFRKQRPMKRFDVPEHVTFDGLDVDLI